MAKHRFYGRRMHLTSNPVPFCITLLMLSIAFAAQGCSKSTKFKSASDEPIPTPTPGNANTLARTQGTSLPSPNENDANLNRTPGVGSGTPSGGDRLPIPELPPIVTAPTSGGGQGSQGGTTTGGSPDNQTPPSAENLCKSGDVRPYVDASGNQAFVDFSWMDRVVFEISRSKTYCSAQIRSRDGSQLSSQTSSIVLDAAIHYAGLGAQAGSIRELTPDNGSKQCEDFTNLVRLRFGAIIYGDVLAPLTERPMGLKFYTNRCVGRKVTRNASGQFQPTDEWVIAGW